MISRCAGAIALAVILQLTVTITSRLFPGLGGGYGAPLAVGRVSPLSFYTDRAGVVTFEPWILVVNLVITFLVILPLLPFAKVPSTAAAGFLGGAVSYGVWLGLLDPGLPERSLYPAEHGGIVHPLALWTVLVLGIFAGVFLWRRRATDPVTFGYGSTYLRRVVCALANGALLQVLLTWTSMLLPVAGWPAGMSSPYGAPLPVGRSGGISIWGSGATFDWSPVVANVVATAALIFLAMPAARTWSTAIVGMIATALGWAVFLGIVVLVRMGAPIPMPVAESPLSWPLFANLFVWAVAGMALWRRRSKGATDPVPRPSPSHSTSASM